MIEAEWRPAWVRGGAEADTTLETPHGIAVEGGLVYVLERFTHRVTAFRQEDGATAWVAGREGSGPGELRRPSAIAALPGGGVAVADPGNGRLTLLGRDGRVRGSVPLRGRAAHPFSICPLADGTFVLAGATADREPVTRIAADGSILEHHALPWHDLAEGPVARRYALLAADASGGACWLALGKGRGFARYRVGGFEEARRYVEFFDLPEYVVTGGRMRWTERPVDDRHAATGVAMEGGRLLVAFMGLTPSRGRLLDVYDARTGAYLHTLRSPKSIHGLASADGRLFVLTTQNDAPTLIAFDLGTRD